MDIEALAKEGKAVSRKPSRHTSYLLLAISGSLLMLVVFWFLQKQINALHTSELRQRAIQFEQLLQRHADRELVVVDALAGLFLATREVEQKEFSLFVNRLLKAHPEVMLLSWWRIEHDSENRSRFILQYLNGVPAFVDRFESGLLFANGLSEVAEKSLEHQGLAAAMLSGALSDDGAPMVTVMYPVVPEEQGEAIGLVLGVISVDALLKSVMSLGHAKGLQADVGVKGPSRRGGTQHYHTGMPEHILYQGDLIWADLHLPLTIYASTDNPFIRIENIESWLILLLGISLSAGAAILLRSIGRRNETLAERNVTLQRQQLQIEQAHREWLDAFDAIPNPIFLHDKDGRLMRANRAYGGLAGCALGDIVGRYYWELFPRGEGPRQACTEGVEQLSVMHEEVVSRGRTYDCYYYPVLDDRGEYRYSIHVMEDVTERRRIELALAEEKTRAQRYLNIADIVILALDRQGRITLINNTGCELLGYEEKKLQGRDWFDCCLPGDQRSRVEAIFRRAMDEGVMEEQVESDVLRRTGERRYLLWKNTLLFNEQGERIGTLSSGMDITERRALERSLEESNARMQAVFDAAQDGILVADVQTKRFVLANNAAERMLGYSQDELAGMRVDDIHPKAALGMVHEHFRRQAEGLQTIAAELPVLRKDGTVFYADFNASPVSLDGRQALLGIVRDTTEQKLAQQALRAEKERAQRYLDIASVIMLALDTSGRITLVNQKGCEVLGYQEPELLGRNWFECCIGPEDRDAVSQVFTAAMENGDLLEYFENSVNTANGEKRFIAWHNSLLRGRGGKVTGVLSSGEDITERRELEQALRASAERLNRAMSATSDGLWDWDLCSNQLYFSPRWKALLGYDEEEIGNDLSEWSSRIHPDDLPETEAAIARHLAGDTAQLVAEFRMRHKDGHWVWILSRGQAERDETGEPVRAIGTHIDITRRREMENEMARLVRQLGERVKEQRCLYDISRLSADTEAPLQEIFQAIANRLPSAFQYPEAVMVRLEYQGTSYQAGMSGESQNSLAHDIRQNNEVVGNLTVVCHKDCSECESGSFLREERYLLESVADRVESMLLLRENQDALQRVNRTLRTLSRSNRILVHADDESQLASDIGQVMMDNSDYAAVWLAAIKDEEIELIAAVGPCEDFGEKIALRWQNEAEFRRRVQSVIADNAFSQRLLREEEPTYFCQELQIAGGFNSVLLPVATREQGLGIMGVYSLDPREFGSDEVELLQELAGDIAYGITSLRTLSERDSVRRTLDKVLFQTIEAVGLTVEKRDPYTAGHQQRVAQLAEAIGREMGLDEERLTGLHLGAIIHDIGKISVPAEILNRPGKLSGYEFGVIKSHPEVGYEIIKGVDFPWPVAQMIYQHHERLDGSGYPNGLKGKDIILESKILAVADVMEAVTSHRPYRPSLGRDHGLEVLRDGRGTHFDPQVVDTCLSLFEGEGFDWERLT